MTDRELNIVTCPYCRARFNPDEKKPKIRRGPKASIRQKERHRLEKMWIEAGIKPGCGGYENYEKAMAMIDPDLYSWAMMFWVKNWARLHVGGT